jgi:colanic acid/amylovoran biosynthesis glycosyltransferase
LTYKGNKTIFYLVDGFPIRSETFIVNQICTAIDSGYHVKILSGKRYPITNSSQIELLTKYELLKKTIYTDEYCRNRFKRLLNFIRIFISADKKIRKTYLKTFNYHIFGFQAINLSAFFGVNRLLKNSNADIYHAQFGRNGNDLAYAKLLGLIKGKILTSFHGYDAHYTKNTFCDRTKYYKNLFRLGDLFTANTPYLENQLIKLGCPKNKIVLMPMGVDTNLFKPNESKHKRGFNLLSVGRLIELKGFQYGIDIVNILVKKGYSLHYNIIGEGELFNNLKHKIRKLQLDNYISLTGPKSQKEIINYFKESDVFMMTSCTDKYGRRETQGVVTLEAQACGLPVVGFRSGGVPYTIAENKSGFLVDEFDIHSYANKLEILFQNEDLRRRIGDFARDFVKNNFSIDFLSEKLLRIYRTI